MLANTSSSAENSPSSKLLLAIDTCGPVGTVALGRLTGESVKIVSQIELEARNCSSTLVAAIGDLFVQTKTHLSLLHAIVAVSGPGSFTGVRVGLAAVKGLADGADIPVVALSRLEVLAAKAGVESAALDAHRNEIYLRINQESWVPQVPRIWGPGNPHPSPSDVFQELLAGQVELSQFSPPSQIAVCDEPAAALLTSAWPSAQLIRSAAPTAADALHYAIPRLIAQDYADLVLLDGHYLRRSDAEIFGQPTAPARP